MWLLVRCFLNIFVLFCFVLFSIFALLENTSKELLSAIDFAFFLVPRGNKCTLNTCEKACKTTID